MKINVVAMRSLHQDFFSFARLTLEQPLHVRFIEYMPVGDSTCNWNAEEVVPAKEILEAIATQAESLGLGKLEQAAGNAPIGWGPARYYRLPGAQGTIGVISAMSEHFCTNCNRLRLTADGTIKPCLFSDAEYDLRGALREGNEIDVLHVFETALEHKPVGHRACAGTRRMMNQIGG